MVNSTAVHGEKWRRFLGKIRLEKNVSLTNRIIKDKNIKAESRWKGNIKKKILF